MLFTPANHEDISKYYRKTFVKFKETGDMLFFIREVNSERVSGTSQDGTPFDLFLSEDFPYEVDYVLPRKSFFDYNNHAALLQRIPAKQYQRGVSSGNVSVSLLKAGGSPSEMPLDFSVLKAFVSKQVFENLDTAVNSDKTSVVLSSRFAFTPANRKIYADYTCVGQMLPKRKEIKCFYALFKPELERLALDTAYKVV